MLQETGERELFPNSPCRPSEFYELFHRCGRGYPCLSDLFSIFPKDREVFLAKGLTHTRLAGLRLPTMYFGEPQVAVIRKKSQKIQKGCETSKNRRTLDSEARSSTAGLESGKENDQIR